MTDTIETSTAETSAPDTSKLPRLFKVNGTPIADPDPKASVEDVRKRLTTQYADLGNADMTGPVVEAGHNVYTFLKKLGSKG